MLRIVTLVCLSVFLLTAVVTTIAGALCLGSIVGKPFERFSLFWGVSVTAIVFGVVCVVGAVMLLVFICRSAKSTRLSKGCCGSLLVTVLCWILFCIAFILLLVLCIAAFAFYSLSLQNPPLDKNYEGVSGITKPVRIVRDENGMVHINASSRHDAIFGQGFVQAQDRLLQMEFYRLVGRGELSSVVGTDAVKSDTATRILNVRGAAESLCAKAKPSDVKFLETFANGVNYYLKHVKQRPIEFFFMVSAKRPLYFHEPEPFTAGDVCLIIRLLQWQLTSGSNEGERFKQFFTPALRKYKQVESLFNNFSTAGDTILSAEQLNLTSEDVQVNSKRRVDSDDMEKKMYNAVFGFLRSKLEKDQSGQDKRDAAAGPRGQPGAPQSIRAPQVALQESLERIVSERFFVKGDIDLFGTKYLDASNAWVARDRRNRTVGASDPHLGIELPSVWYYSHLSFPDEDGVQYDAAGVGMVGIPGVHIGKTTYVSWGITMSMTDLEDLFLIANMSDLENPPASYTYKNKVQKFVSRQERIIVSGASDINIDVEDTIFGPVVNKLVGGVMLPDFVKIALYSVPLRHDDNDSISTLLSLSDPAVKTAEDVMNKFLTLRSPGFSIPIADRHGNLAYAVSGRHPLRPPGHTGKLPFLTMVSSEGTYVSDDPKVPDEAVPATANPHFYSPADGTAMHISAANQKIYPNGYPYELGFQFAWEYRGRRLHEMLNALQSEEGDQMANITRHLEIQRDIQSNVWSQEFRPILDSLDMSGENAGTQKWKTRLLDWDMQASIGSVETAFFWRWLQSMSVLPLDTQGSLPKDRYVYRMLTAPDDLMKKQCALYAVNVSLGDEKTTCKELAVALFARQANTDFTERWGEDLNQLTGIHKMLHKKIVRPVFERTVAKDGDMSSLAVSGNSVKDKMNSTKASSVRQLYDWSNPDFIYFSIPGGQSGNPYSPYYQNMLDKFGKREYVKVAATAAGLNAVLASGAPTHEQVLSP